MSGGREMVSVEVERMNYDNRNPYETSATWYDLIVLEHRKLVKVIRHGEGSCYGLS